MERESEAQANPYITRFPIIFRDVKPGEHGEVAHFVDAIQTVAQIYALQDGPDPDRGNLYPQDATKEELEAANRKNPQILERTTIVSRDENGNLVAKPYSQEYTKPLGILSHHLELLSKTFKEPQDAEYYQKLSQAIAEGDFDKAKRLSILMDPKIKFAIGLDRYRDRLMGTKDVFSAFVGIKNEEKSQAAQSLTNDLVEAYALGFTVRVRVDDTMYFAGLLSEGKPRFKMEEDPEAGQMITIFSPVGQERDQMHASILSKIFPESNNYSKEELETLSQIVMLGHELTHPYFNRTHERSSLGEEFAAISELYCDIFGITNTVKLRGKSVSEKLWKLLIPHVIASCVLKYQQLKNNTTNNAYFEGALILFNNFLKQGAIYFEGKELKYHEEGFLNVGKNILKRLERIDSKRKARRYIKRYSNTEAIEAYTSSLQN